MKKIYTACDLQDAHIIANILQQNDIHLLIKNKDLTSLIGELPMQESQPAIWVSLKDENKARKIIEEASKKKVKGAIWQCSCGESLEPQFTACWQCGKNKPG